MEESEKPRRKYQSGRRKEQARETRRRILEAALKLFATHGYTGATIEAIAQEAGVSPLTIFAIFGNKHSLLSNLVGVLVGGDDQPTPLLERPGPLAVLAEPDPSRKVHLFAADITEILARMAPVFDILRMAAKTEPEIAEMLKNILQRRLRNIGAMVKTLSDPGALRDGLDHDQATDMVWTIASPEVYRLLVSDRGWSKDRFSQWLGDTLDRLLLP